MTWKPPLFGFFSAISSNQNHKLKKKVDELGAELSALKSRMGDFPESGEADSVKGIRRFPVYDGRYSAKWVVNHITKTVTFIALSDSKYPKHLREFQFDE